MSSKTKRAPVVVYSKNVDRPNCRPEFNAVAANWIYIQLKAFAFDSNRAQVLSDEVAELILKLKSCLGTQSLGIGGFVVVAPDHRFGVAGPRHYEPNFGGGLVHRPAEFLEAISQLVGSARCSISPGGTFSGCKRSHSFIGYIATPPSVPDVTTLKRFTLTFHFRI